MPVKNGAHSTPRRKSGARRSGKAKATPRADRAVIKNLVRNIPSLILQDGYVASEPNQGTPVPVADRRETRQAVPIHVDESKRRWLWTGVTLCTLFIFGFWLVNVRTMFFNTFGGRTPEKEIFQSTRQDFQALMDTLTANNQQLNRWRENIPTGTPAGTPTVASSSAPSDDVLRAGLTAVLFTSTTVTDSTPTDTGRFPIATTTHQ